MIRPSVAYTVQNLVNGVYQDKQPRLYSNGSPWISSELTAVARMEFQIPQKILVGLKTAEFRAQQNGFAPTDTGDTYLWYYTGNAGETTNKLGYARSAFTAEGVDGSSSTFSRNLLLAFSNSPPVLPVEKFGLMITTRLTTKKEVTFEDPRLVITYEPPPENNAVAVTHLLTEGPGKPFEGQTDPAIISFDADPDSDGLPNFYELWRGTAPDKPSSPAKPTIGKLDGLPYVRVVVNKYADDRMLIGAQASHNLVDWRDISATRTSQVSSSTVTVTFTDVIPPTEGQSVYFRFVAEPEDQKYE